MGSRNLDALLAQQKCMFNKEGIGYTFDKKQKSFQIFFNFVKASSTPFKHVTISCIRVIPLKIVWLWDMEFQMGYIDGFL